MIRRLSSRLLRRVREGLTYANVMVTLLAFLVLGGGTAYAVNEWTGANIVDGSITTADIRDETVRAVDITNGGVGSREVKDGVLRGIDVKDESLTGADIKDNSGVDTCPPGTARFGALCAGGDGALRDWYDAAAYCADLGLRLPSSGEGNQLERTAFEIPGSAGNSVYWTDELAFRPADNPAGYVEVGYLVYDGGIVGIHTPLTGQVRSVCVTTPTS